MNVSRLLVWRKRESEVRQCFEYTDKTNKSSCLVKVESDCDNKSRGLQLVGKNPINLRVKWNDLNIYLRRYRVMTSFDPLTCSDSIQSLLVKYIDEIRRPTPKPMPWHSGPADDHRMYDLLAPLAEDYNCCAGITCLMWKEFSPCVALNCRTQKQNEPEPGDKDFVKLNKQLVD